LLLGGEFNEETREFIRPGHLSYYRTYWDYKAEQNVAAPPQLRELFQSIKERLEPTFRCLKGKRVYWLGPGAASRLRTGAVLVGLEHVNISN